MSNNNLYKGQYAKYYGKNRVRMASTDYNKITPDKTSLKNAKEILEEFNSRGGVIKPIEFEEWGIKPRSKKIMEAFTAWNYKDGDFFDSFSYFKFLGFLINKENPDIEVRYNMRNEEWNMIKK